MAQLLVYRRPVALNRALHHTLKLKLLDGDFSFAAHLNSVPLAVGEFARAAGHCPIVFAGEEGAAVTPAALLGLRAGENLFVDAQGRWLPGTYVPAFLRRYPFGLAERPGGEDFAVCLDHDYAGVGADDGEILFDGEAPAPLLSRALEFLRELQAHMRRTETFVATLRELELLHPRVIRVQPAGAAAPFTLKGFQVVDEERLRGLEPAVLERLARNGDLGWIYAHLVSLARVEGLSHRLDRQFAGTC